LRKSDGHILEPALDAGAAVPSSYPEFPDNCPLGQSAAVVADSATTALRTNSPSSNTFDVPGDDRFVFAGR